MESALYVGKVFHERLKPKQHRFSYKVYQIYLDLDELDDVSRVSKLLGQKAWLPVKFVRKDFHGDTSISVKQSVYKTVYEQTGLRLDGPVRVLCNWRCFGFNFNPLSTYFCFDQRGEKLVSVVAEVTNTPWLERHAYVLKPNNDGNVAQEFDKAFTVSPFNPLNMRYDWFCSKPNEKINIRINNFQENTKVFGAAMVLERRALNAENIQKMLLHFPIMSLQVVLAIYWQALRLFIKKIPFLGKDKVLSITVNQK